MAKNTAKIVVCPECKTKFVRQKAETETCGICGKAVAMKDTKKEVTYKHDSS